MSKVTNIKQQVKRKDRYAVYVDEKYSFSLGELELINSGIKIGLELSREELDRLKDTSQLDKLYDKVLNYLAIRQRSEWEIKEYLKSKKAPTLAYETILNKLSDAGYIDDQKFAEAWLANRRLLKSISKRRLVQELRQKHIDSEIIDKVLEQDETSDLSTLHQLIVKKRQHTKYQDDLKLMQYLARQGYNYGDIKQALRDTKTEL